MQSYRIISASTAAEASAPAPETQEKEVTKPEPTPISAVTFSLDPDGIYLPPQTLALACNTPGAVIRYALATEEVGPEATIFDPDQPLVLTQSTQIAAQARLDDQTGPISVATYIIKGAVWQKREPDDPSDPVPHEVQEAAALPDLWQFAAASKRGKLHAHRGLWREDAFAWGQSGLSTFCVVSDGAGSAPLSRIGSHLLCATIKGHLEAALESWLPTADTEADLIANDFPVLRRHLVAAAKAALQDLHAEAARRERPLHDFAATLLILARCPWHTSNLYAALQVGDGAVALYSHDKTVLLLGVADHGEHSSETRFLTTYGVEADLPNRVSFCLRDDIAACTLLSDGVSDDFFPEDKRLGDLFDSLLPTLSATSAAGESVLQWLGYEKKGSSDDRTLLILWAPGANTASEAEEEPLSTE